MCSLTNANVLLPKLISNNMVLQRDSKLKIWGWADVNEEVSVEFRGKTYFTYGDAKGKWEVILPPQKVGEPSSIIVQGNNKIEVKNVIIGDVWLCGGQSNMEWSFNSMPTKYVSEIAACANFDIRILTVERNLSFSPLDNITTDGWNIVSPYTITKFSAIGYFLGQSLQKSLGVPIGLISSNWGGTPAEAWTSIDGLKIFGHYIEMKNNAQKMDSASDFKSKTEKLAASIQRQINKSLVDTLLVPSMKENSEWKEVHLPDILDTPHFNSFDGVVWYTGEFDVPKELINEEICLNMPPIDDNDYTYVNGVKVGSTDGYSQYRKYKIPANLIHEGRNRICIRITDYFGGGGMNGLESYFNLECGNTRLPLAGKYYYKIGMKFDIPSRPVGYISTATPSVLYNGMIAPLVKFPLKGVIWYQGEANTEGSRSVEYEKLLPALIRDWRKDWKSNFSFLFVQLANYKSKDEWARLRESQLKTLSLPKTGMVVTIDIGDSVNIHPSNKKDVGERLALAALHHAYKKKIVYSGPLYKSSKVEGNSIRLTFDHTGTGLAAKGNNLNNFMIAGEDKVFVKANAIIDNMTVLVSSPNVTSPKYIRYAWQSQPTEPINFYNKEGLPASPFRTDSNNE